MDTIPYSFTFTHVPPGFKRGRLAIIAAFKEGQILMSRKHVYPEEVYRLPGGGINLTEDVDVGAIREFKEETGAHIDVLSHKASFKLALTETSTNTVIPYAIEVFYTLLDNQVLYPSDDIDILELFSKEEFQSNTERMKRLSNELVEPKKELNSFRWSDWGTVFAVVHEYVLEKWVS